MPGVGLKKKGEDEVSVYYNMAYWVLPLWTV